MLYFKLLHSRALGNAAACFSSGGVFEALVQGLGFTLNGLGTSFKDRTCTQELELKHASLLCNFIY
jgi:hypothetical protein